MTDIRHLHNDLFHALMLYYDARPECFRFMLRQKDRANHTTEDGYLFIGNDQQIATSFWDAYDSDEYSYSIHFTVASDGHTALEISARSPNQADRLTCLTALVDHLSQRLHLNFRALKHDRVTHQTNKWSYAYPTHDYLQHLDQFITCTKPMIDDFLQAQTSCPIPSVSDDKFQNMLSRVHDRCGIDLQAVTDDIHQYQKATTGPISAKAYILHRRHDALQRQFLVHLQSRGEHKQLDTRRRYVDIIGHNEKGTFDYFTIQPITAQKALRQTIGRLLEHAYNDGAESIRRLCIVSDHKPYLMDIQYLEFIRRRYIPHLYYVHFDPARMRSEVY